MDLLNDFHLNRAIEELIETIKEHYPERVEEGFAKKTGSVMAAQKQRQQQAQVGQAMKASTKAGQQLSQKQDTPGQAQPQAQPQQQPQAQAADGQQKQKYYPKVQDKVAPWLLKLAPDRMSKAHIIKILKDAQAKAK